MRRSAAGLARTARRQLTDPGLGSLRSAARAAIVMPAVFAVADKVIQDPQTATFAAFGSFAMLVMVDFTGPWRTRLAAYLALAVAGAGFIVLGTLCSRNAWLAAAAMAVVGFAVLFSGVINGYLAAAGTSAMLTFILPVTLPATASVIPARLAGWGLAAAAGTCAAMLLWPSRSAADLRAAAARACLDLAELSDAELRREPRLVSERADVAREAVAVLRKRFLATPHRPTGPAGPAAALAALVDELDWLLSFLRSPAVPGPLELCRQENADLMAAVVAVLRASASRLAGGAGRPDLERLEDARAGVARAVARRLGTSPQVTDDAALTAALEPSFRLRVVSYSARQVAGYALRASGAAAPDPGDPRDAHWHKVAPPGRSVFRAAQRLVAGHASVRSVWLRNSVRGAVGVGVAVFIAQRSGLQHGFWVVLGTLSVLRSNAFGTGATIIRALAGTAVGILAGSALVIAIGTSEPVLWAVLPVAVLLAAYAPRAISFAAGQAGFTIVLFILFNIIQPVGWKVGLVRVEDVAIGFAVSLGVGLLFWPRGAAALLRENLAAAYARNAEYVTAAAQQLLHGGDSNWSHSVAQAAHAASDRLDDAFRQYLAERAALRHAENLGALVAGAARLQRAAESLAALRRTTDAGIPTDCAHVLDGEIHALRLWYVTFGDSLVNSTGVPQPHTRDAEGRSRLLQCVRNTLADGGMAARSVRDAAPVRDTASGGNRVVVEVADSHKAKAQRALVLLWASQHLDNLWRLEGHLARQAAET